MKKLFIFLPIVIAIIFIILTPVNSNSEEKVAVAAFQPLAPDLLNNNEVMILEPEFALPQVILLNYDISNSKEQLKENIQFYNNQIQKLDNILTSYKNKLSYDYQNEIMNNRNIYQEEILMYESILDSRREEEFRAYPVASEIWEYLKNLGYNDYIAAGIIGNMMAESGGQTFKIDPYNYDSTYCYFGICQWNKWSYKEVQDKDLKFQLDYLRDTIKYEFNVYGKKYKQGFDYEAFLNIKNEKEAALAFAKAYERCGSGSYNVRQKNATKALEYFAY